MTEKRLGVPDHVPEGEEREDGPPLLFPVIEDFGPHAKTLFLGNLAAAEDRECLLAAGITETLNVSINMFPGPMLLPDGTHIRRYQIGMIDGDGNDPHLMEAAVFTIEGLMRGYVPSKPHYPKHRKGNILVHCRGGRSRSVALIALWLFTFARDRFASFESALAHLRQLRGLDETYPLPPMLALAEVVRQRNLLGAENAI